MSEADQRAWLKAKMPYASENQAKYFIDKVGELVDGGLDESIARANALKMMKYAGVK